MRTWSKNLACGAFCLIRLACGAFYFIKNLACCAFFSYKILFLIIPRWISLQISCSVYQFISSENDLNSNTEWSQRHNLYQQVIINVWNNKPLVQSNLLRYKSHNTISIPNNLLDNTCNIIVTNTFYSGKWVLPAQRSASTAAPTDACEPIPLAK